MRLLPHTAPTDSAKAAPPSLRSGRAHPAVRVFPNPAHLRRCPGGNTQPPNSPPANISGPFFDRISPTDAAPFTARTPCRAVPESCRFRTASRNGKAASFRPSRTASLLPAGRTRPNGIAVPPGSVTSNRGNKRFYVFDILFPTVCPRKHPVFPSTLSLYHTFFQNAIGLWKNIQLIADILLMFFR